MRKALLLAFAFAFMLVNWAVAQERAISGTVTDAGDGSPIPGVNVLVKGTSSGTITSADGKYSLKVADGATLIFSFVGYLNQEVLVGSQSVIDISLGVDAKVLEEVVVTGYGDVNKQRLTGSISVVGSEKIGAVPIASFDQILQGQSPGLLVQGSGGQPGAAAKVRIRGNGSINASNTPLYIVDNVPLEASAFATLNPNDFASVSVLKDASAVALYGSRGSNGVIVITTKRGESGKINIEYRHQSGWSKQARDRFEMMNASQKIDFEKIVGSGPTSAITDPVLLDSLRSINTNWRDIFIRTGRTTTHELNFSGGSASTNFYASVNYFSQEGQALRSSLDRYTVRLNVTSSLSDKFLVGINSSMGFSESSLIESENAVALANPFAAVYLANPYESLYNPETGLVATGAGRTGPNAFDRISNSTNTRNEAKAVIGAFAEFTPFEGFTLKSQLGIDYRQRDNERYINPTSFAGRTVVPGNAGLLTSGFNRRLQWNFTNTANYTKTINDVHSFGVVAGIEALQRTANAFGVTAYGLNPKLPLSYGGITVGPSTVPAVNGGWNRNSLFSLFSIFDYTYDDKYNFRASLRRDGSSRFGAENQFATFWSVSGSWNIDKEDFMQGLTAVNLLKLRTSYGTSGNQDLGGTPDDGNFNSLTTYGTLSYNGVQGTAPATLGDPALKWEVSNQFNVGLDFGLWKNRVTGTVEFYNNLTTDLLITKQLSRSTGFAAIQTNAGSMRNRGLEFSLDFTLVRKQDLMISVGGNFTYNKNEITSLGKESEFVQGTSVVRVGLPLNSQYVVEWAGVNPANGQPLYKDLDGNVTTTFSNDYSKATFGTSEAPIFGGFNSNITYKGFTFTTLWTYMKDFSLFNNQRFFQENHNFTIYNLSTRMLEMWQEPGDVTDVQSFRYARQFSSKDIEDASFLRLRNVTLSYTLPAAFLQKTKTIHGVRIYAQGQNLLTFTKFTGFDPEDNNNIAQYEYPASRVYTIGIDVKF